MSFTQHQLPGGGRATVIHRKLTQGRPLLIHSDLPLNSCFLCGLCGASILLQKGHTLEDASKTFHTHCKNHRHGRGTIPAHPTSEVHSEKILTGLLQITSGATSTRATFEIGRSRLRSTTFLKTVFGEEFLSSLTFTPNVTVSRCCLSREARCCVGRTQMTVDMYRAGDKMEPILCSDDLEKLQFEHNLLCPPPPPPPPPPGQQSGPNAETVAAFNNVVQDLKRSRPGEGSGPSPPSSASKKHKVHVGAVVDGRAGIAIEERPGDKTAGSKFLYEMFLEAKKVREEEKAKTFIRGMPRDLQQNPVLTALDLGKKASSLKERAVELAKAHEYRPQENGRHIAIMAMSWMMLDSYLQAMVKLDVIHLLYLSKLSTFCAPAQIREPFDARNTQLREFKPRNPTAAYRRSAVFKLLLTMEQTPAIPGSAAIKECIDHFVDLLVDSDINASLCTVEHIVDQCASSKTLGTVVMDWVYDITSTLSAVFKTPETYVIELIAERWAFATCPEDPSWVPPPPDASGMNDELEVSQPSTSQTAASALPPEGYIIRGAAVVRSDLSNLSSIIKYIVGVMAALKVEEKNRFVCNLAKSLEDARSAMNEEDLDLLSEEIARRVQEIDDEYLLVLCTFEGSVCFPYLCTLIANLHRLEDATGGLTNMWKEVVSNAFGPVFQLGDMEVSYRKYSEACWAILVKCIKILEEMISIAWDQTGGAVVHQQFFDVLTRAPRRDAYRIRPGASQEFSCPRLEVSAGSLAAQLRQAVGASYDVDPDLCSTLCQMLDTHLLSLLSVSGSCTLRSEDVLRLNRGTTLDAPGNLVRTVVTSGDHALAAVLEADKTFVEAVCQFPPIVSKLVLVRLDVLAPFQARHQAQMTVKCFDHSGTSVLNPPDRERLLRVLETRILGVLETRLDMDVSCLCPMLLKNVRTMMGEPKELGVELDSDCEWVAVKIGTGGELGRKLSLKIIDVCYFPSADKMNSNQRATVCEAFELEKMTIPQYRSLMVNIRAKAAVALDCLSKLHEGDPDVQKHIKELAAHGAEVTKSWELVSGGRATGNHSPLTQLKHYLAGRAMYLSSGSTTRVPELLLTSAQVFEAILSVVVAWPSAPPEGDANRPLAPWEVPQKSIREHLQLAPEESSLPLIVDQFRQRLGDDNLELTPLQKSATAAIADSSDNLVMVAGCGTGKTAAAVFPYMLVENEGLVVVFAVPFRTVVWSHAKALTRQAVDYEICLDDADDRFNAGSWTNGTRAVDAPTKVVLLTYDRMVSDGFRTFLRAGERLGRIGGIVMDECHELITARTYRECMYRAASLLANMRAQVVFLSGTLPKELVSILLEFCGMHRRLVSVISDANEKINEGKRVLHHLFEAKERVLDTTETVLERALNRNLLAYKVVVFLLCPSIALTKELAETLRAAEPRLRRKVGDRYVDPKIFAVSSESTNVMHDEAIGAAMAEGEGTVLLCCTSGFGAGLDIPGARMVFVVGGIHSGLLAFMQACGRVGRGRQQGLYEVFFICSVELYRRELGKSIAEKEAAFGSVLGGTASEKAKRYVTFAPLVRAAAESDRNVKCFTRVIEATYSGRPYDEIADCGKCRMCVISATLGAMEGAPDPRPEHELFVGVGCPVPSENELQRQLGRLVPLPTSRAEDPQPASEQNAGPPTGTQVVVLSQEKEEIRKDVIDFWQKDGMRCPGCRGELHLSKFCPVLKEISGCCHWCYRPGHWASPMKTLAKTESVDVEERYEQTKDCAYVYEQCIAAMQAAPCFVCWFSHRPDQPRCFSEPVRPEDHRARLMATIVYSTEDLRTLFVAGNCGEADVSTWAKFFRWLVYGGEKGFNNVYLLVEWWRNNLSEVAKYYSVGMPIPKRSRN